MIFPDLPKQHKFFVDLPKAPLIPVEVATNQTITAEAWFEKHFPEEKTTTFKPAKTPSFAEDPRGWTEFILLILFLIGWVAFWKLHQ